MSKEKSKYNNTKTIEDSIIEDSIGIYWSDVGGYISDAMAEAIEKQLEYYEQSEKNKGKIMSKEKANRIPDVKETINTVDTGLKVLCPYCGERNASFEGGIDIDEYTGDMECNYCDNNFRVELDVSVNFSTYKIEANNE